MVFCEILRFTCASKFIMLWFPGKAKISKNLRKKMRLWLRLSLFFCMRQEAFNPRFWTCAWGPRTRKEGLGEGLAENVGKGLAQGSPRGGTRLAKGWHKVGGFPCTFQFCNSRGAGLEDRACDYMVPLWFRYSLVQGGANHEVHWNIRIWRLKVPNSRFALHGLAPP